MKVGYTLSSEEHPAPELVEQAERAERAGFDFVGISDHFSPWTEMQGNAPFSWSVIGAVSQATTQVQVFMEVVCPIMRYHPAIVAQAAATSAALLEGRFVLGVGTGEWLNEHIVGQGWPHISTRREMLAEAIGLIRRLWTGQRVDFHGRFFQVEAAKLYSLPRQLPPIVVSGFGPKSVRLAGQLGDGLVSLAPKRELVEQFEAAGGLGKPKYAQIHVCYAATAAEGRRTAFEYWPNAGIGGQLGSELRLPAYFEQAAEMLDEQSGTKNVVVGPDAAEFRQEIEKYLQAGYDHVYLHQIGPKQTEFLDFCQHELLPGLDGLRVAATEAVPGTALAAEGRQAAFRERLENEAENS